MREREKERERERERFNIVSSNDIGHLNYFNYVFNYACLRYNNFFSIARMF